MFDVTRSAEEVGSKRAHRPRLRCLGAPSAGLRGADYASPCEWPPTFTEVAATAKERRRADGLRLKRWCAASAAGRLTGDVGDIGAVDADILQLSIRIGRQFVQNF